MIRDAEANHFMMTDTFNISDKNGVVFEQLSSVNTCKHANLFCLTSQFSRQAVVKCHGVCRLQTFRCAWQKTSRKCRMTGFKRCCDHARWHYVNVVEHTELSQRGPHAVVLLSRALTVARFVLERGVRQAADERGFDDHHEEEWKPSSDSEPDDDRDTGRAPGWTAEQRRRFAMNVPFLSTQTFVCRLGPSGVTGRPRRVCFDSFVDHMGRSRRLQGGVLRQTTFEDANQAIVALNAVRGETEPRFTASLVQRAGGVVVPLGRVFVAAPPDEAACDLLGARWYGAVVPFVAEMLSLILDSF